MKVPLITILIISSCLQLEAFRSSTSPAVSEAFCNTRCHWRRSSSIRNTISFLGESKINRSKSSSQISFVASSIHDQDVQYHNNHSRLGRRYFRASSHASQQHHATNSSTAAATTLWLRYALNRIRQFMLQKWSQGMKLFRVLTIASIILVPSMASSSSSSSSPSSYYLQSNPFQTTHSQQQQRSEISIQTQPSQPYPNRDAYTVKSRRQYPQTTRFVKQRSNRTTSSSIKQTQKVKRTTLFIMLLTLAASSFRASLRKSKIVRNVTPFGVIRNASPLGNGVSVIRVCMALKVDDNDDGNAKRLLNKLYLEEKELYNNISMLSQDDPRAKQPQKQQQLDGAYSFRQQAIGRYVSNVASTFLQYTNCIRYGNMESIRVPFEEDAVREFRQVAKEERQVFATTAALKRNRKNVMPPEHKKKMVQQDGEDNGDTNTAPSNSNSKRKKSGYILATILLSIKGDRTSVPLPFGIVRQRDVGRALSRIATDAKIEDCLVGSEISWVPNNHILLSDEDDIDGMLLSEKEVLKAFPDLISLT